MKRLLMIALLLSAVGCMSNRWGALYDGRYTSSGRVQAYADKHGITYEESFKQLHSDGQQMWNEVDQRQQAERLRQQPPVEVTEAQQVGPVL